MAVTLSTNARNASADGVVDLLDGEDDVDDEDGPDQRR